MKINNSDGVDMRIWRTAARGKRVKLIKSCLNSGRVYKHNQAGLISSRFCLKFDLLAVRNLSKFKF